MEATFLLVLFFCEVGTTIVGSIFALYLWQKYIQTKKWKMQPPSMYSAFGGGMIVAYLATCLVTYFIFLGGVMMMESTENDNNISNYPLSPNLSETDIAKPGKDTIIELDDGAALEIPSTAINEEVTAVIERNPKKINSLPPLGEGFIQLSDFYDFRISDDSLNSGFYITIPLKEDIPEGGFFYLVYPENNGWIYTPFNLSSEEKEDGKVRFYTQGVGDPLIAWHFNKPDSFGVKCPSSDFSVDISPEIGDRYKNFTIRGNIPAKYPEGIEIIIEFNYARPAKPGRVTVVTDKNGDFKFSFTPKEQKDNLSLWYGGGHSIYENSARISWECTINYRDKERKVKYVFFSIEDWKMQNPPAENPILFLDKNLFCRTGPGTTYPDVTSFFKGQSFPIIGRASNGWYLVPINVSTSSHKSCWIGGGIVSGDLSKVKYYEVQQPSESNGSVPIYDLYSDKVIGYLSCTDIAGRQWWKHPVGWMSNARLFGSDNALFYPYDSKYICGWEGGTPPRH